MNTISSPLAKNFTVLSLLKFAAPSIGMMIIIALYTVTDGIFIGQYAGANALAASNIVYPAINIIFGMGMMLASGGSALVAKNLGERKLLLANKRFSLLTAASFTIGTLIALTIALFFDQVLVFLGASELLMADCRAYLGAMLPFFPIVSLMTFFEAFYIADGRPIQGFIVSLLSGLTNALLDYLFLAYLDMGIMGAGLATGLAYSFAALAGIYYFSRAAKTIRFATFNFEKKIILKAFSNGASELVTNLSMGVTTFLFNILTFYYAGEAGVAAMTTILYAELLLTSIFVGFTNGIAPIFSYKFGAHDFKALKHILRLSIGIIAAGGLIAFTLSKQLAVPLVTLFLPEGGEVFKLTINGLSLFSFSFLLCGFNIFGSGFFTALSDGRTSAILSFARNLAGIVIFLLILPKLLAINGVWLAVPLADITALLLTSYCIKQQLARFDSYQNIAVSQNNTANS